MSKIQAKHEWARLTSVKAIFPQELIYRNANLLRAFLRAHILHPFTKRRSVSRWPCLCQVVLQLNQQVFDTYVFLDQWKFLQLFDICVLRKHNYLSFLIFVVGFIMNISELFYSFVCLFILKGKWICSIFLVLLAVNYKLAF